MAPSAGLTKYFGAHGRSWLTTFVPLEPEEFKTGITIFFCTPCAIAYSVVLTKNAGGNVALAIFLVVLSNVLGSFITPMTLSLFVKAGSVGLPVGDLVAQLVGTIFAPLVVGKALQELPFKNYFVRRTVHRDPSVLGVPVCVWSEAARKTHVDRL